MTSYVSVRNLSAEEQATIQSIVGDASGDVAVLPNADGMYRGETRAVVKLLRGEKLSVIWPNDQRQFYDTFDADWIGPVIFVLQYSAAPIVLGIISNYLSSKLFNVGMVHIRLIVPYRGKAKDFRFDGPPHAIPDFTEAVRAAAEESTGHEQEQEQEQAEDQEDQEDPKD